jgi:glycosyltransferase involved in cell wall biosynthesis
MKMTGPLRIAMVTSILAKYDAISNDVVRTSRFLQATPDWEVSILTGHNEFENVNVSLVERASDLLIAPAFVRADVVIYHFGIFYQQFDAILMGNGRAKQAVVFHNITPVEFVSPGSRGTIERSFAQLANIHAADAIWPDSRENEQMLLDHGFDSGKITIQPLAVDRPGRSTVGKPVRGVVELIFIGRIVRGKGVQDLIEALGQVLINGVQDFRLRVIGDMNVAEASFREHLIQRVKDLKLTKHVEFLGAVPDEKRDGILLSSHILVAPSYHEGFCVPVIEALRAGVVPIVYSAYNLKYIADGLCVSVNPGFIEGLSHAIVTLIEDVKAASDDRQLSSFRLDRDNLSKSNLQKAIDSHLEQFESENVATKLRCLVERLSRVNNQD